MLLYSWFKLSTVTISSWKLSKYGVFSGPYFPAFGLNTGKYGPEKTRYLDTFHAVLSTVADELFECDHFGVGA